eukprot:gene8341-8525_t
MNAAPRPPVFPQQFEAKYKFSLPYVKTVQTNGLQFPVSLWYDGPNEKLRVDVFAGVDSTVTIKDTTYLVYPRINVTVCDTIEDSAGPTLTSHALLAAAPLPDISDWEYGGTASLHNAQVHIWQRFNKQMGKVSTYTFYTTEDGTPVRFYIMGFNILAGSHFDEYLLDFDEFKSGPINDDVFAVPSMCKGKQQEAEHQQEQDHREQKVLAQGLSSAALMPWAHAIGSKPTPTGNLLQLQRLAALANNRQFVEAWNTQAAAVALSNSAEALGFKLAINRFADWLPEEYSSIATAKRSSLRSEVIKSTMSLGVIEAPAGLTKKHLPKHVDWRGSGADNIVKDQATCGSCWAFSAVGAMQGAWYLATGQVLGLSEQQLVDCSWNYGNNGCQGGEMEPAIQYIADAGGAAAEEDYQYLGQNMFCNVNATNPSFTPVSVFKGFKHVKKRDELSLMYALWKHGPVAISLDASQPTFRFYSEGVYKEKKCLVKKGELDHAVLLVGYGDDKITGEPYWLPGEVDVDLVLYLLAVDCRYIRMLRTEGDGNDCGISSDPVVAVVVPEMVKPGPHTQVGVKEPAELPLVE